MATTTVDTAVEPESRAEAAARLWSRVRLPLVLAPVGAALALVGAYLYWTVNVVEVEGVPLTGNLVQYGFGGPRAYVALVAVAALLLGALLVARPSRRDAARGSALRRLGIGITGVALGWSLTLVFFEHQGWAQVGPGAWVGMAAGLVVWLAARSLLGAAAGAAPAAWPRRALWADLLLLVGVEAVGFLVFLCGVGTATPGTVLGFFSASDASAFIAFFLALVALGMGLAKLGLFRGLAGPLGRMRVPAIVLLAALLLYFPFTQHGNTFWIRVSAQAAILVVAALGLNIVVGSAGLLDLGYVAFVAIGAYTAAFTGNALLTNYNFHLPFILVMLVVAPLVAAFFGALLGAPTLRLRGDYLAIVTLGFGEIVRIVLNNADKFTRGPNGISSIPDPALAHWSIQKGLAFGSTKLPGDAVYLYLALGAIALVLTIVYRVNDSRIGRAWVAIREDEVAAAAMGINTTVIKLLAFASGAFFAGMAGSVNAHLGTQVSPDSYTFDVSVLILAMVVLGGIGNPPGVVLGAIILTFLPEKLRDFSDVRILVFGIALVLIMRFRPEGLLPSARRRRELHAGGEVAAHESQRLFDVMEAK